MSAPTPAALAAAEEINGSKDSLVISSEQHPFWTLNVTGLAAIIDRHTAPKAVTAEPSIRYFTDGHDKWELEGNCMCILIRGNRQESYFSSPSELLDQSGIYETDEHGRKLAVEPEGGEG